MNVPPSEPLNEAGFASISHYERTGFALVTHPINLRREQDSLPVGLMSKQDLFQWPMQ